MLLCGDSTMIDNPPINQGFGYVFDYYAYIATRAIWRTDTIAQAGDTLSEGLAHLDADIAGLSITPDYVFIGYGKNDCQNALIENNWKDDLRTYLETLHTAYADAQIGVTLIWRSTSSTTILTPTATIRGWIQDVVAEYAYAFEGPDESVILEGGDDGATMTENGTHLNGQGAAAMAAAWVEAIGL